MSFYPCEQPVWLRQISNLDRTIKWSRYNTVTVIRYCNRADSTSGAFEWSYHCLSQFDVPQDPHIYCTIFWVRNVCHDHEKRNWVFVSPERTSYHLIFFFHVPVSNFFVKRARDLSVIMREWIDPALMTCERYSDHQQKFQQPNDGMPCRNAGNRFGNCWPWEFKTTQCRLVPESWIHRILVHTAPVLQWSRRWYSITNGSPCTMVDTSWGDSDVHSCLWNSTEIPFTFFGLVRINFQNSLDRAVLASVRILIGH